MTVWALLKQKDNDSLDVFHVHGVTEMQAIADTWHNASDLHYAVEYETDAVPDAEPYELESLTETTA